MTTPRSESLDTARKRLFTAAMDQPNPTVELKRALNQLLILTHNQLRLRAESDEDAIRGFDVSVPQTKACTICCENPANYGPLP